MRNYCTHLAFIACNKAIPRVKLNNRGSIYFMNHGADYEVDSISMVSTRSGFIYEVWIEAESDDIAYGIADLLVSAMAVVNFTPETDLELILHNIGCDDNPALKTPTPKVFGDASLYSACKLVKRAVNSINLEYALYKYYAAQMIFPIHPFDLQPDYDKRNQLYLPTIQTRIGNAIVASFSIIEELGLKENASKEEPSVVNKKWNPIVYDELCKRLEKHGIDPFGEIPWLSRGEYKRPFINIIDNSNLCKWSFGDYYFDFEIKIVEAIFEISHLRNKKAAHANRNKLTLLSIIDIENANALARYILAKYR